MEIFMFIVIAVLGIFVLINLIGNVALRIISTKLTNYLLDKNYTAFDKLIDSGITKIVINPFNRYMLLLNESFSMEDDDRVEKNIALLESLKLSDPEKKTVYLNAFYYYINKDKDERTTDYYNRLKSIKGIKSFGIDRLYNTFVLKNSKYLEETLNEMRVAPKEQLATLESLVSIMYKNKGDKQRYEEYQALSEKHMKENFEI